MRWSFMDSIRILCVLTSPFLYLANSWVFSLSSWVISLRTYSMTSFSVSTKSILFFHARKFVDPTSLLFSLKNEVILFVDWDMENNMVLACQTSVILDDAFNYLDAFKILQETSKMSFNNKDPSKERKIVNFLPSMRAWSFLRWWVLLPCVLRNWFPLTSNLLLCQQDDLQAAFSSP